MAARSAILVFLSLSLLLWRSAAAQQKSLTQLIATRQYPELGATLNRGLLKDSDKLLYHAFFSNAINQPIRSQRFIEQLKSLHIGASDDSLQFLLHQLAYNNAVLLNDYKAAYAASEVLLQRFTTYLDPVALKEQQEESDIWDVLQAIPPQTVVKHASSRIKVTTDMAGLWNIPVQAGDSTYSFIFDTGAGISTVSESYAQQLRLVRIGQKTVSVKGGINGINNLARLGVAPRLKIGKAIIENAVFLILPDSALSFGKGVYKINGIIGLPVIKGLEEISISSGFMKIPAVADKTALQHNLILDLLEPVIYLSYHEQPLAFSFDSGAQSSLFSDVFYKAFQNTFKAANQDTVRIGGVGGDRQMTVLTVPELSFENNGQQVCFKNAQVSLEPMPSGKRYYFGNLGQDLIRQFGSITLNFANAIVSFGR